jgi:NIMA (never in mitosis gene a)-related kinase
MDETISISSLKDFELLKQIGKGSFGTVYRVRRKRDGMIYAMKCMNISKMDKKGIENCLTEIRILCSVIHPNVVGYKEAFLDKNDSELNIVMEYVGGGDLSTKISQCAKRKLLINEPTIWKYFCQTLLGLKALHSMKIIHRDIKSANLFLSEDFESIKLGDLNVAKITKNDLASTQIGTPYYLAPEIWKNEVYSYKCDVFSLGCVLYEMAALKVPFEGSSMQDLYKKVTRGIINKIPNEYSEDLYTVIKLCLATDHKQRPTVMQLLANPIVASRISSMNINLRNDQIFLDKLMNTIKVDKNYNNKLKFALPNSKRYRNRSAENIQAIQIIDETKKPLLEPKEALPSTKCPAQNYSQKKISVINPLEKFAEKEKSSNDKPTAKLPPIKNSSKQMPPAPIHSKGQNPQLMVNQKDNSQNKNPSLRNVSQERESSKEKNPSTQGKKYNDYLEKLIEQNNQYLKEKGLKNEINTPNRARISSADPRKAKERYPSNEQQHRGNPPIWWG